jgi:hypothetical protein
MTAKTPKTEPQPSACFRKIVTGGSFMKKCISEFSVIALVLAFLVLPTTASYAASKPKYSADVPKSVVTPDKVQTESLGTLEFFDGMPSSETLRKVYDNLDLTRAVTVFLDAVPITSMHGMLRAQRDAGMKVGEVGIFENFLDARSLFLTPNTTVIYILAQIDLSDGPVVMNAPPQMLGLVDDAAFRFLIDVGLAGPDEGKGGKFLFVPPGYKGDIPEGYFVAKARTFDHWVVIAGVGDLDGNGKADLIWRNTSTGDVGGWLMNGLGAPTPGVLATAVDLAWVIKGVGDLDDDGKSDLVWRKTANGDVAGWLMDGLGLDSFGMIAGAVPADWVLENVGDLDGDGKADLVWRNTSTGDVGGWLMNGLTLGQTGVIASGVPFDWEIQP